MYHITTEWNLTHIPCSLLCKLYKIFLFIYVLTWYHFFFFFFTKANRCFLDSHKKLSCLMHHEPACAYITKILDLSLWYHDLWGIYLVLNYENACMEFNVLNENTDGINKIFRLTSTSLFHIALSKTSVLKQSYVGQGKELWAWHMPTFWELAISRLVHLSVSRIIHFNSIPRHRFCDV